MNPAILEAVLTGAVVLVGWIAGKHSKHSHLAKKIHRATRQVLK